MQEVHVKGRAIKDQWSLAAGKVTRRRWAEARGIKYWDSSWG